MKTQLYIISCCCIAALSIYIYFILGSSLKHKGEVSLKNGEGAEVNVPYKIFDNMDGFEEFPSTEFSRNFSKDKFTHLVKTSSLGEKYVCRNNLTYEPREVTLTIRHDTISVLINFHSKNGFGVPIESNYLSEFKGDKVIQEMAY